MKTAVVIPTYNEKDNIARLVKKILSLKISGLTITIVDDNSPDGTGKIGDKLAKASKKVQVIHRPGKMGLGSAYKAGIKKALKDGADAIFTMDADLSHDPKVIPDMLDKLKDIDLVIGSRYVNGGKIIGFDTFRSLLSGGAQFVARFILGIHTKDATSGFRVYRVKVLKGIKYHHIKSEGYSYLLEALFKAIKIGFSVTEVPIIFRVRKLGKSKLSQAEIYKAVGTVFKLKFVK